MDVIIVDINAINSMNILNESNHRVQPIQITGGLYVLPLEFVEDKNFKPYKPYLSTCKVITIDETDIIKEKTFLNTK